MKITKKQWIIIGIVVAIILVWYFFLRKKKAAESNYRMKRRSCASGMKWDAPSRRCVPVTRNVGVPVELNPIGTGTVGTATQMNAVAAPVSFSRDLTVSRVNPIEDCKNKCLASGKPMEYCVSLCTGGQDTPPPPTA